MNISLTQTARAVLPYRMTRLSNGKVKIVDTRGHVLFVTRDQIIRHLGIPDLSVRDRRKYEAALQVANGGTIF